MAPRRLSADEAALWARVMAGVRPLLPVAAVPAVLPPRADAERSPGPVRARPAQPAVRVVPARAPAAVRPRDTRPGAPTKTPANTLDGTWDRQLSRGLLAPDRTIDLHGHTLASAHSLLDAALDQAIRGEERVLLLITGKPPRPASERPHAPNPFRGAIRAATGDWLAQSRFSAAIAAVRPAHPRHGGAGALYIVLRKTRPSQKF